MAMKIGAVFQRIAVGMLIVAACQFAAAEVRLWTDATGDSTMMAEFLRVERGNAVLRTEDGREKWVPINKLSDRDRAFIRSQRATANVKPKQHGPAQVAEDFYNELRSEEREGAMEMLTPQAQEVVKEAKDKSPLALLPTPDEGNRTIRVGRPSIDGKVAEVPVQVRAGGGLHKTKVHLRQEEGDWLVFALSAVYPEGEKSLNFETPPAKEGGSRLDALVGQPFPLMGMTLDGRPLDLSQYQGKTVLVDFWATWCGPCRTEMQNIAANYAKYRDKGFDVIAVSVDKDLEALSEFVTAQRPPWAVVADQMAGPRNSMAARYGISSLPSLVLVGPDGKVVAVNCRGEALGQELAKRFAGVEQESDVRYANQLAPTGSVTPPTQ